MPHVYKEVDQLERTPLVGGGDCVALVKALAPGLTGIPTFAWRQGVRVVGSKGIARGTAIATFENGHYPQRKDGRKHAAFFLAYAGASIWVMDQWKDDPNKPSVSKRIIHPGQRNRDGTYINISNAAEMFYVIEM